MSADNITVLLWHFDLTKIEPHRHFNSLRFIYNSVLLLLLLLQMKRLKWCCRENAAGALYKIIRREKLVNVSQNYGRIEMSSAGVWMEWGRKQFEEMMVDCSMHAVQRRRKHDHLWVDLCTGGTTSVVFVDDRRWRRLFTSAVRRMFSARYAGADPSRQRCVRTQRRNVIRSGTRSQWSSPRSGEAVLKRYGVALFWSTL